MGIDFTPNQQYILEQVKLTLPESFINFKAFTCQDDVDKRLLAYSNLVLGDINIWPPLTNYTLETMPTYWNVVLILGTNTFAALFSQMNWTLLDFGYSESGLSLNLDRVNKIDISYKNLLELYKMKTEQLKKSEILKVRGRGLGTPRYQSQIGQFLKIALGSSFVWNQS